MSATKLKAIVKVRIGESEKELTFTVGDGKQTIRWLSTVVLSRLKEGKFASQEFPENSFIVTGIRNSDGKLVNPIDSICEHIDPSDPLIIKLSADLAANFDSDEWGNIKLSQWQINAFVHSKTGVRWAHEIAAWRESLAENAANEDDDAQPSDDLMSPRNKISLVQIGTDFSEADIETAFLLDWKQIKCAWLPSSASSIDIMNSLSDSIRRNYALICNIYAHYSGIGVVGERYGLSLCEFGHILHLGKILNINNDESKIEEIFFATARVQGLKGSEGNKKYAAHTIMTRSQFADAIMYLASLQVTDSTDINSALSEILNSSLGALWRRITSSYYKYISSDPDVVTVSNEFYRPIKKIFNEWAYYDPNMGSTMDIDTFSRLVNVSTIAAMEEHQKYINNAFWGCQFNPSMIWELQSICLAEFQEAMQYLISRTIDGSSSLTSAKRLRMGYTILLEMDMDGRPQSRK